jgi:uncharacterized protein (TIGR02266 family)
MHDRRHTRVPLALEISYRSAGTFLVAYTTNLSKGGVFIETDDLVPVGTEIVLRLGVPGEDVAELAASVAWVSEVAEGGHGPGMGLRFEHLDVAHGELVDRLVSRFRGVKVLVIGLDAASRTQLARMIRSVIGAADVREAKDAESGEAGLAGDVDLVLLDLAPTAHEPRRADQSTPNASELLLVLRLAKAQDPPVPVIALAPDGDRRTLAVELGADVALASPPSMSELQADLLRLLGRPSVTTLR